jgi:hypothetical protein
MLRTESKLQSVQPHPMHDHHQLVCDRHDRALVARLEAPGLQAGPLFCERTSRLWPGSYRAVRTSPSPHFEMHPSYAMVSPDSMRRGVRPKCAPTVFDLRNRCGSPIPVRNVSATTGPLQDRDEASAELVTADHSHNGRANRNSYRESPSVNLKQFGKKLAPGRIGAVWLHGHIVTKQGPNERSL